MEKKNNGEVTWKIKGKKKEKRRQRSCSRNRGINDSHRSSDKGGASAGWNAGGRLPIHTLAIRVNMDAARAGNVHELVARLAFIAHVKALTVSAVLRVTRDAPSDIAVVATLA